MPTLKNVSAAEEEDDQLFPNPEADRLNPEAEEEEEEDPSNMDEKDEGEDMEVEHDVKRNEKEEDEAEAEESLEEEEDSKEGSQSYASEEEQLDSELSDSELELIRNVVQCPICLGIIKNTRTFMTCLHRFCRECINKSMRLGKKECPACRIHCASKRSLRDDPAFDALIACSFKNIERFEAEELAFHEDDETRKKQIQLSIAQVSQRQSEAVVKRRYVKKDAGVLPRSQRIGSSSRRRRNCRNMGQDTAEAHDNDDGDDNSNRGKDSSSDEPSVELVPRKRRKRTTNRLTADPSSSSPTDNCANNGTEEAPHKDSREISPGPIRNPEILAWGRGGTRSSTRQGNNNQGASIKSLRNARLNRLVDYLGSLESNSVELDMHLTLVSLDTQSIPNLPQPHLRCQPTMLVKQLREHVALQMQLTAEEVDLLVSKEENMTTEDYTTSSSTEKMQSLKDDETLAKLKADCVSGHEYMIVVYQKKQIE